MVRAKGLEPPRLASLEPKSSVSTNSTTPAETEVADAKAALYSIGDSRVNREFAVNLLLKIYFEVRQNDFFEVVLLKCWKPLS